MPSLKILTRAGYKYLILRALEEMEASETEIDAEEIDKKLIAAIQLINLARYTVKCNPSNPEQPSKTDPKRKSSKPLLTS